MITRALINMLTKMSLPGLLPIGMTIRMKTNLDLDVRVHVAEADDEANVDRDSRVAE